MVSQSSRTVLIAPLLPGHKPWPFVVNVLPSPTNGIDKNRHINLKQLRAVDVSRFGQRQGVLENQYLPPIHKVLAIVFGMKGY
jgi:mRNA interferase MazF